MWALLTYCNPANEPHARRQRFPPESFTPPQDTIRATSLKLDQAQALRENAPAGGRGVLFAAVTFYNFRLLSTEVQLRYVLARGTYLAQRWQNAHTGLNLYHLPDEGAGYFVEVGIDEVAECIVVRRSFRSIGPLEGYVAGVELPEGWA